MFAAGGPSVSAHRRSLVTATAAGALLCALWFVPTAKATPEAPGAASTAAPADSAQPEPGTPGVPSLPGASTGSTGSAASSGSSGSAGSTGSAGPSAHAAPPAPPAAAEDGFTSPFALSALGLASAGGFLIVRACSRTARAARPGTGGGDPR